MIITSHFVSRTQVFITPLRKVTNTAVVDGLLRFCRNYQDRLFLQALGMAIGNKHWADDFKEMQQHPESMSGNLGKTVPLLYTQPINNEKVYPVLYNDVILLPCTHVQQGYVFVCVRSCLYPDIYKYYRIAYANIPCTNQSISIFSRKLISKYQY